MLVSVVIPTRNEEKNIKACLESVKSQTFSPDQIEIIVVDNNSTDMTKEIARMYTTKVYNMGPERSSQRNYGAKKAIGKYYLYLDADMMLSPTLLAEAVKMMDRDKTLVALYIPEIVTGENWFSKIRRFERSFYNATAIDCVRFVRMSAFEKIGGFDTKLTGPEDWDFTKKIAALGTLGITKSPKYHNESDISIMTYVKKKSYYIRSLNTYISKWGSDDPDIKKQVGIWYRFFWVFVEKGKWKKVVRAPHLFIGVIVLRILIGGAYITR